MKTLKIFDIGPNVAKDINDFISTGIEKNDHNKIKSVEGIEIINEKREKIKALLFFTI